MASSKENMSLTVDDEDELQFKDSFSGFSDAPILNDEEHAKLLPRYDDEKPEKVSFWEFKYYQNLFNVDTRQVMERIIWSAIPRPGEATYLHRLIRPNPDLYGPFWISVTLIFTIAVSSNIAEYLQSLGAEKTVAVYDYKKVTFTATTLFSYILLLPLAISGFLWYFESAAKLTVLEIICIYGYSLAIYIPISILWIVKVLWLQGILIFLGFLLSTSVMMLTFWPAVRDTRRKISAMLLLVICLFHALLCFGFSVYFFQPQHLAKKSSPVLPALNSSDVATPKYANKNHRHSNPATVAQSLEASDNMFLKSKDSLTIKHDDNAERNPDSTNAKEQHPPATSNDSISQDNTSPQHENIFKSKADTAKTATLTQGNSTKGQQLLLEKTNAKHVKNS